MNGDQEHLIVRIQFDHRSPNQRTILQVEFTLPLAARQITRGSYLLAEIGSLGNAVSHLRRAGFQDQPPAPTLPDREHHSQGLMPQC
jgi:hypothetical protein